LPRCFMYPKGALWAIEEGSVSVGSTCPIAKIANCDYRSRRVLAEVLLKHHTSRQAKGAAVKIRDWMNTPMQTVKPRDSIAHARALLERHRINQLPVVVDGAMVGIVTDRDLRNASPSAAEQAAADLRRIDSATADTKVTVESVMTQRVFSLGPEDTVEDAVRIMRRERLGAIPVVERGRVVGILTRSDVLDAFMCLALGADLAPGGG
jgi:CBS domain-containing protein